MEACLKRTKREIMDRILEGVNLLCNYKYDEEDRNFILNELKINRLNLIKIYALDEMRRNEKKKAKQEAKFNKLTA